MRGGHPQRSRPINGLLKDIPLGHDGQPIRRLVCNAKMAAPDAARPLKANQIDALVSTLFVDRGEDIILPRAYANRLASYKRNPTHLWAHSQEKVANILGHGIPDSILILEYGFQIIFDYDVPMPFAEAVQAGDYSMSVDVLTHSQQMSLDVLRKYLRGDLNAFSVGVDPFAWSTPDKLPPEDLALLEKYVIDPAQAGIVYTDVEMWEISGCGVPMNRQSLNVDSPWGRGLWQGIDLNEREESPMPNEVMLALQNSLGTLSAAEQKQVQTALENCAASRRAGNAPVAKRSPLHHDLAARLHAAADTLSGENWQDQGDEPDLKAEHFEAIKSILTDCIKTLDVMTEAAPAGNTPVPAIPVTPGQTAVTSAAPAAALTRVGAKASSDTQARIGNIHACVKMADAHMKALMKSVNMDPETTPETPGDIDPESDTNDGTNNPENPDEQTYSLTD